MEIDFKERKNYLGASDAPVIMGVSPWSTQYKLWQEKLDLVPPKETNWAMKRGTELEPIARDAYISITGAFVEPRRLLHPEISFMLANMDGITPCGSKAVEIKNPGEADHAIAKEGKIPDKYYPQLQHQLEIMHLLFGVKSMDYFSYRNGDSALIEVKWDEKYTKKLCSESKKFWKYIETLTPPPMTDKDYTKRNDDDWSIKSLIWSEKKEILQKAQEIVDRAKQEEEEAKEQLILCSNGISSFGSGVKLVKGSRKGLVNYKIIPELKGVDLDLYRGKTTETWTISKV